MLCDWFIDKKLSIFFGEHKTKSILFGSRHKVNNSKPLNFKYNDIKKNQYFKVTYFDCIFDETLYVIDKINSRWRFLHRQNRFFNVPLRRQLYNAMTQPFFNYACNSWYPNVN